MRTQLVQRAKSGDPWSEVSILHYGGNGDGTLLYPGPREYTKMSDAGGSEMVLASVRMKHIRDGLEDLEYLYAMQEKFARSSGESLTVPSCASAGGIITTVLLPLCDPAAASWAKTADMSSRILEQFCET